ncbi:hypothetical protein [Microbispora sp. NPDC046933]
MHLHCYAWTSVGDDRRREAERRPSPSFAVPGPFLAVTTAADADM